MKTKTTRWLHEARVSIQSAVREFSHAKSMSAPACDNLFTGVEKAIKAPLMEMYGTIPKSFRIHELVSICQSTGLWGELPSHLQRLVSEINSFNPNTRYPDEPAYWTLVNSSTPGDWNQRLTTAGVLVNFIEKQVIADPSVLGRLK